VEFHGLGIDKRFERGVVIGKRCEFVSHFGNLLRFGLYCGAGEAVERKRTAWKCNQKLILGPASAMFGWMLAEASRIPA